MDLSTGIRHQFVVSVSQDGLRLDQLLCQMGEFSSRSRAQEMLRNHCVFCDGAVVTKSGSKVRAGQAIAYIVMPPAPSEQLCPQASSLNILYEDEALVVINKSEGMCVHAGAGNPHGTLVEAILGNGIALSPIGLPLRPGVVHRLDKGTSGVIVFAKTERAHHALVEQFSEKTVRKTYLALVIGRPKVPTFTVSNRLGRHPSDRQRFASCARSGKPATTHFRLLAEAKDSQGSFSLIEAQPETGRTHQIRVHLSEALLPIVGDATYGGGKRRLMNYPQYLAQYPQLLEIEHPFLHAYRLEIEHPLSKQRQTFEAPLPNYLLPFVDRSRLGSL